jgi:hypothetical protein
MLRFVDIFESNIDINNFYFIISLLSLNNTFGDGYR